MWIVGKKIMAIKNHSQGAFKEGDIFVLKGVYENVCKCPLLKLDIGMKTAKFISQCPVCKEKTLLECSQIWLFNEDLFKPLDEDYAENILENVMENVKKEELCEV